MTFVNVTDYEALPNLDSSYGQPLVKLLQLGPGFSVSGNFKTVSQP